MSEHELQVNNVLTVQTPQASQSRSLQDIQEVSEPRTSASTADQANSKHDCLTVQENKTKSKSLEEIHITENPSASPKAVPQYSIHSPDLRNRLLPNVQVKLQQNGGTSPTSTSPRLRRALEGGLERTTTGSPFKRRIRRANSMGATMFSAAAQEAGQIMLNMGEQSGLPVSTEPYDGLQMMIDEECEYYLLKNLEV